MGIMAIVGAALLALRSRLAAYTLIVLSLCLVGGWFLRRMLSGHPDGTSLRVIVILVVCAMDVCVLLWRCPETQQFTREMPE